MDYLEGHANGVTTILFVRKKADPCTSYVTMEICEDEVKQLYGRFNRLPHRDIYEFIEKYSLLKGLKYGPESIIDDAININNLMEIDEEVWDYIEDFYRRKDKYFIEEENDISNTKLALKDCYPELF